MTNDQQIAEAVLAASSAGSPNTGTVHLIKPLTIKLSPTSSTPAIKREASPPYSAVMKAKTNTVVKMNSSISAKAKSRKAVCRALPTPRRRTRSSVSVCEQAVEIPNNSINNPKRDCLHESSITNEETPVRSTHTIWVAGSKALSFADTPDGSEDRIKPLSRSSPEKRTRRESADCVRLKHADREPPQHDCDNAMYAAANSESFDSLDGWYIVNGQTDMLMGEETYIAKNESGTASPRSSPRRMVLSPPQMLSDDLCDHEYL